MKIKATVKTEKLYNFNINGKTFPGFTVESEWEGIKKLVNQDGNIIVADFSTGSGLEDMLSGFMSVSVEDEKDIVIYKMSLQLIEQIV